MENEKSTMPVGAIFAIPLLGVCIYRIINEVPLEAITLLCVAVVALAMLVRSIFRFIGKETPEVNVALTWITVLPGTVVIVSLLVSLFS